MDRTQMHDVDSTLVNLLKDDKTKLAQVFALLVVHDEGMHYPKLAALQNCPQALRRYVDSMIEKPATAMPPGCEGGPTLSTEKAQQTLFARCRECWGSRIARLERTGILPACVLNDIKRGTVEVIVGESVGKPVPVGGAGSSGDSGLCVCSAAASAAACDLAAQADAARKEYADFIGTQVQVYSASSFVLPERVAAVVDKSGPVMVGATAATAASLLASAHEARAKVDAASHGASAIGPLRAAVAAGFRQSRVGDAVSPMAAKVAELLTAARWASNCSTVLTVGFFGCKFYRGVRKYYRKEIDVETLAEGLTATIMATGASFAGGWCAAMLCAGAGPAGILFVAAFGAVMVAGLAEASVRHIFLHYFGTQRDRTLAKAYETLGVKPSSSPTEIRSRYLELAWRHHPQNQPGGKHEEYIKVNCAYELVRASRSSC